VTSPHFWPALVAVRDYFGEVYTVAGMHLWLESPNRNLDGRAPLDLWADGDYLRVLAEARRVGGEG
jgi:Protein of unknown function (DUF2384)